MIKKHFWNFFMLILLFFTFLAGVVTILAPCIWPLLPIILSATADGGRRKPLGIVTGIGVAFTFSTLFLAYLLRVMAFDPAVLRIAGVVIIAVLGCMLLIPSWGKLFESLMSRLTNFGGRYLHREGTGFVSGFMAGGALGFVWSPCAGPILGTVATLAATQTLDWTIIVLTIVFVTGVMLPLYIFAWLGQRLFSKLHRINPHTGFIQRIFGGIMIVAAILLYTGYDEVLRSKAVETYPVCEAVINPFESNTFVEEKLRELRLKGE